MKSSVYVLDETESTPNILIKLFYKYLNQTQPIETTIKNSINTSSNKYIYFTIFECFPQL